MISPFKKTPNAKKVSAVSVVGCSAYITKILITSLTGHYTFFYSSVHFYNGNNLYCCIMCTLK